MIDTNLRSALLRHQRIYGTPTVFVATKCGVSREHLSRWIHNESYVISNELKTKIKLIIKGEI